MEFENNNIEMNEEMTTELVEVEDFETNTEEEKSGLSTLAAMAIGAGVTAVTFGVVNLVKKGFAKLKAKKERAEAVEIIKNNSDEDIDEDVDEVADDK